MASAGPDDFESRLACAARRVETRLSDLMDAAAATGTPPRLVAAMRHGVLAGGKRFRPFLVLEMAALHGGELVCAPALEVAASLECVHAYSLVHDDLPAMDNDELRRGHPTVWRAFDDWTAILAGDALLTIAFELLAGPVGSAMPAGVDLPPATRLALVRLLAQAAGPAGMVGGQMLDLEAEKLQCPTRPDAAHVRRLQAMKTGALITYASEAGALAAGATPHRVATARRYGAALGLAFQIADDLLDVTGDAAIVGKAVGKDAALGKATLVAVLGETAARRRLDEAVADALAALEGFGSDADVLRSAARQQLSRQH